MGRCISGYFDILVAVLAMLAKRMLCCDWGVHWAVLQIVMEAIGLAGVVAVFSEQISLR